MTTEDMSYTNRERHTPVIVQLIGGWLYSDCDDATCVETRRSNIDRQTPAKLR